jgi:hypothetical protein
MGKLAHHRGSFDRRAKAVRAYAYAHPDTICQRCGYRLHEGPHHRRDGTERWEAGHVNDGEVGGLLAPETRSCNRRAAAQKTNARRRAAARARYPYRYVNQQRDYW